jgi:hypothetical protein
MFNQVITDSPQKGKETGSFLPQDVLAKAPFSDMDEG